MKHRTVASTQCFRRGRLDSHYYLAPGVAARDRIDQAQASASVTVRPIGGQGGFGDVWQPLRFKRAYAAPGEDAVPYLRPYDVFEYLPSAADLLSTKRTEDVGKYRIAPGTILQTCSGRNLGPVAVADAYLSRFVLSHDMVRIEVEDLDLRSYLYVFLSTPTGQAILRQRMSGSVVDHLTTDDVLELLVPVMAGSSLFQVSTLAARSLALIEEGRLDLDAVLADMRRRYPPTDRERPRKSGWSTSSRQLTSGSRLDAHYFDPEVNAARDQMREAGGHLLRDLAKAILPGRYKRYYVEEGHGRPILSGRQLLQIEPVNLRYISDRSFKDPEAMVLAEGMVAFGAVGRWEGRLGEPSLITADREGWMASNDVMRIRPNAGINAGWLWLALATEQVQRQIAALPYGSVIDHTGPDDVERQLWLPPVDAELGLRASAAWEKFADARALKQRAVDQIESMLEETGGDRPVAVVPDSVGGLS